MMVPCYEWHKKGSCKDSEEEPRAVYMHCYGHALNLPVNDTIRKSPVMKSALDTVNEVSKLREVPKERYNFL